MGARKVTIAAALTAIVAIALTLAAVRSGSNAWSGGLVSLAFFSLLLAPLGLVFGRGGRRVFWVGFAFLGWSYVALTTSPSTTIVAHALLAPNLFNMLQEWRGQSETTSMARLDRPRGTRGPTSRDYLAMQGFAEYGSSGGTFGELEPFARIGWALEALLWANAGGWAACWIASKRRAGAGAG